MTVATCRGEIATANDRLARLRALLPTTNAIVGIDLADDRQAAVVTEVNGRFAVPMPGPQTTAGPGSAEQTAQRAQDVAVERAVNIRNSSNGWPGPPKNGRRVQASWVPTKPNSKIQMYNRSILAGRSPGAGWGAVASARLVLVPAGVLGSFLRVGRGCRWCAGGSRVRQRRRRSPRPFPLGERPRYDTGWRASTRRRRGR